MLLGLLAQLAGLLAWSFRLGKSDQIRVGRATATGLADPSTERLGVRQNGAIHGKVNTITSGGG